MNSDKSIISEKQIVIIGGGGAGLAAALAAMEKGATDILVLEKLNSTGGISAMAVGPFAADSPAQRRQSIIAHKDDLYKKALEWGHLRVNPRIVRAFIDRSGDTIKWLEKKGLFFTVMPHSPIDNPHTMHVAKGRGAEVMKTLAAECKRLGVQISTGTRVNKLLTNSNGKVTGVTAAKGSDEFTVTAKSVIIATGGYAGNKDLMQKYGLNTENMVLKGLPHTGDGLLMATQVGAATDGLGIMLVAGPHPVTTKTFSIGTGNEEVDLSLMFIVPMNHREVLVNKLGRRFVSETAKQHTFEATNVVRRQPNNLVYTLFDHNMVMETQEMLGQVPDPTGRKIPVVSPESYEKAVRLAIEEDEGKTVKAADSWEKIANWIGCDPAVLQSTINEYNECCDRGHDAIFAKDREYLYPLCTPPYYAFTCTSRVMNTLGGIKINEKMEVVRQDETPIPGLYAAGVDAGGWTSDTYCTAEAGSAFGFALNSGRIAGESALKYVLGQS